MFTEPVIELDIYTYLRKEPSFTRFDELEDLRVLIPTAGKSVTLPLRSSVQRHGNRMHFICSYCNRQVQKLYVHPNRYDHQRQIWIVACRSCHGLKYSSQYEKDGYSKRCVAKYKLFRLEKQNRRYWHGDERTQFGKRYEKLRNETKTFWDIIAEAERQALVTS